MLVLTAALVAPYFIDWTPYRADFEREAGRILGREVRVEGSAHARLLPFPSVTFTDVVVAGAEPGQPAMTVDEFSMDAELAPFLSGELLVFDMRLVRPSMNVEIRPDGRIDWAVRPSSPFDPRQVTLEKVTISDGTVTAHQQASGRTVTFGNIESTLSARTLAGPWRVQGSLDIDGIPVALNAATGTAGEDGTMRVRITAEPQQYPLVLEADGQARLEDEAGLYAGTFRLRATEEAGPDEARRIAEAGNRLFGRFSLDHQRLALDEFRFETGPVDDPYTAEGNAVVELGENPSFAIAADGAQIRLGVPEEEGSPMSGLSADERLAALTRFVTDLPKPAIPGTISVNLPAIVAGDTTIREIRVEAEPVEEGWSIGSLAATLPGRTRFEGEGLLATGEALSFTGSMILAVGQPSGFAAWLARDVDEAIRRLPRAGFSADVTLTEERQRFDNLELMLGEARFRGAIDRESPPDARPSLMLALDGDQLDVEGMQAFASLFVDDAGQNRLADHDVDLDVTAGPVVARGLTAQRVDTALRLREGALEIDRLTISGFADASISATGHIAGIGSEPTGQVDATVVAVDLAPLVGVLARRFTENRLLAALDRHAAAYPGLLSDSEVNIVASAAGNDTPELSVSASGTAGGSNFSLSVSGSGSPANLNEARLRAEFEARNDEAATLYALVGLPALPFGLAGAAGLEFSATGVPADGMDTSLRVSGDGLFAGFEGSLTHGEEGLSASGDLQFDSEDLEPWLSVAGVSLPGFGYGLPVQLSARLNYGRGMAMADEIAGEVAGSTIGGDLRGEMRNGLPHLTGALALGQLDIGLGAEMVFGSAAFEANEGTWPQTPFEQNVSMPFSADVELSADRLWVGNAATADEARMHLRLGPEGMAVSDLSAHLLGGSVEGLAEMRNNAGTGLLSAQLSLGGAELESLLPGAGLTGRGDLNASMTASGKSVNAMIAALSGSGSAALRNLEISGIDNSALPPIIEQADELGVEINAGKVVAFAPELVSTGSFSANDVEFAFTVSNGVVRTPPVQLESVGARMSVEAAADLPSRTVSASGSITYDAGQEAVMGSDPVVRFSLQGPVGEARPTFDTEPLTQFLTQRALELEQARVEHMQAVLLERQRLRREARYFAALAAEREEAAAQQRRAEEAERIRLSAETERMRNAEEERARRLREEEEEQRRAEEAAREESLTEEPTAEPSPEPEGDTEAEIERLPLPPPQQGNQRSQPGEDARSLFDNDDLSVERLLQFLDQ